MNPAKKVPKSPDRSTQADLWRRGIIGPWKYDSTEIDMVRELDAIFEKFDKAVCLAGRRTGKTFIWAVKCLEIAIKTPNTQIKYISSTTDSIREYLLPIFTMLLEDCPADIRPTWLKHESAFNFWNGSRIKLFGTDSKNFRKLRGQASNFTIVDECGFMSDLETTVTAVLSPQALRTGGKMILSSSAPDTPGHYFAKLVEMARTEKSILERTIYQRLALGSFRQTAEEEAADNATWLKRAIVDCYGESTTAFQREYLNDLGAVDSTRLAMPHFTTAVIRGSTTKPGVVRAVEQPKYCHKYTAGDLGFIDQSAFITGYVVPGNTNVENPSPDLPWTEAPPGAIVITDELIAVQTISDDMKPLILDMERTRWGVEAPFMRVIDGTPEQLAQLQRVGLEVYKTRNDKPDVGIDELQKLILRGLVIIHPRCVRLIACMQAAVWKKDGLRLDRHAIHGHYDLMMALVYLVRNVRRYASPFPHGHDAGPRGPGPGGPVSDTVKNLRAGFKKRLSF